MSFLAELQRRKAIRVAVACASVARFMVQTADTLLCNFDAPR